jgi:hypothetical protein
MIGIFFPLPYIKDEISYTGKESIPQYDERKHFQYMCNGFHFYLFYDYEIKYSEAFLKRPYDYHQGHLKLYERANKGAETLLAFGY